MQFTLEEGARRLSGRSWFALSSHPPHVNWFRGRGRNSRGANRVARCCYGTAFRRGFALARQGASAAPGTRPGTRTRREHARSFARPQPSRARRGTHRIRSVLHEDVRGPAWCFLLRSASRSCKFFEDPSRGSLADPRQAAGPEGRFQTWRFGGIGGREAQLPHRDLASGRALIE